MFKTTAYCRLGTDWERQTKRRRWRRELNAALNQVEALNDISVADVLGAVDDCRERSRSSQTKATLGLIVDAGPSNKLLCRVGLQAVVFMSDRGWWRKRFCCFDLEESAGLFIAYVFDELNDQAKVTPTRLDPMACVQLNATNRSSHRLNRLEKLRQRESERIDQTAFRPEFEENSVDSSWSVKLETDDLSDLFDGETSAAVGVLLNLAYGVPLSEAAPMVGLSKATLGRRRIKAVTELALAS